MHGGQKRTRALVDRYRELSSNVTFVSVYLSKSFKLTEVYKSDIALSSNLIDTLLKQHSELTDIVNGSALHEDEAAKALFVKLLKKAQPQVVHVEQPYMVESVAKILDEIHMKCIIIFGSQNVESEMKRSIYKNILTKAELEKFVAQTDEIEKKAVSIADIVIGVSAHDLVSLTDGSRFRFKFYIPNGIESSPKRIPKSNDWTSFKTRNGIEHIATFIGSAHPPNYLGFIKLLAKIQLGLGSRIIVAGGVSNLIKTHFPLNDPIWNTIYTTGRLSNASLHALIYESDVILLPILNGGGSNLKTAEAIISGKKIVATEYAFRGYEKYMSLPNIYVANSAKAFERALNAAFKATYIQLTTKQKKLTQTVTWTHALIRLQWVVRCAVFLSKLRVLRI